MAYISQNFGKFSQREVQRIYEGKLTFALALAFISAGFPVFIHEYLFIDEYSYSTSGVCSLYFVL